MSITFKVLPKKNPQDLLAPEKFYATAIAAGETDLERLATLISYQCTVIESDCLAVLTSLEHNIIGELGEGRIVKLGRLGNFQVGISSEGKVTSGEVTANAIKKSRILLRPGKKLRQFLKTAQFKKTS
ncbi:DNA-binding protein [Flavobacterium branchiophilum]|uniref:Putative histone-like DNA-binding protein n=1 Tax=Flavobacterium branchiophilum TaxID=55197 RepID=A0A543G3E4_9FLAO|nr:DsbA family protein [Flavobacterium branchiophilum]OXA72235.1 DNA-binding protein [Flavobacterium branchiophilum] [Flavobacterium branchiophilum NBRC 15030 = ATCC 35035]TQM40609.1 putative histone-like DNA-binding protein [Flavobacterium branchiophilum]GEM55970.1 DNA-binding protein [Flavobacterium branchiophilum NBRC 15030 = ATCC 35035]